MIPVEDISIKKGMTANQLIKEFEKSGGFSSQKVSTGVTILENMFNDKDCTRILAMPSCIIATGTRGVVIDLIKNKKIDAIITTIGTIGNDLARLFSDYYHGSFNMDDVELHKKGIYRLGNVLVPRECYGEVIEAKVMPILEKLYSEGKREFSTKEIIWEIGKALDSVKDKETSLTYWIWKNQIPIFVPGPSDGVVGSQFWMFSEKHKDFKIDVLKDERDLANFVFDAKKLGALIIGGGISKHHTIWWAQFKDGLDYAVYITTAVEYDGSLSGAQTREAISWGKLKEAAKHITIEGEATVLLPLMIAALKERGGEWK